MSGSPGTVRVNPLRDNSAVDVAIKKPESIDLKKPEKIGIGKQKILPAIMRIITAVKSPDIGLFSGNSWMSSERLLEKHHHRRKRRNKMAAKSRRINNK